MQSEFTFIWCVEYPHRLPWEIRKMKAYFINEEEAQQFVDNYPNICSTEYGPCRLYDNTLFKPYVEKHLSVTVLDQTYTFDKPITFYSVQEKS